MPFFANLAVASGADALDVRELQRQAAQIFAPTLFTESGGEFGAACDRTLLLFQALSVAVIVVGLLSRVRREHEQLEGMAAMLLKVAFIATIPFWRGFVLDTSDVAARAIGFRAAADSRDRLAAIDRGWDLLGQWLPPGSPHLDALESQSNASRPASGEEVVWAEKAWNWARGLGARTTNGLDVGWQTTTGGLRAALVFAMCSLASCAVAIGLLLTYLAELGRLFVCHVGFALLPVFIAGLGVDALRGQSFRAISVVIGVAVWPVGWAFGQLLNQRLLESTMAWMKSLVAAAADAGALSSGDVTLAVAAPALGWGVLILLAVVTLVLSLSMVTTTTLAPLAVTKLIASGTQAVVRTADSMLRVEERSVRSQVGSSARPQFVQTSTKQTADVRRESSQPRPRAGFRVLTPLRLTSLVRSRREQSSGEVLGAHDGHSTGADRNHRRLPVDSGRACEPKWLRRSGNAAAKSAR